MGKKAQMLIKRYSEKKAKRCTRKKGLQVHHKIRTGTNKITNAQVLCKPCHYETDSFGEKGPSPPDFTAATIIIARARAGGQCQCTSTKGCH